jgi:hypothetical protein
MAATLASALLATCIGRGAMKPKPTTDREFRRPWQDAARPFRVVILAGTKTGEWGKFSSVEAAAEVAAKLRRHGMYAVIEEQTADTAEPSRRGAT